MRRHSLIDISMVTCMQSIYRTEGVRAFYRGLIPPLVSFGALNAILFSTYAASTRHVVVDFVVAVVAAMFLPLGCCPVYSSILSIMAFSGDPHANRLS